MLEKRKSISTVVIFANPSAFSFLDQPWSVGSL
jgi:hypothetical protein